MPVGPERVFPEAASISYIGALNQPLLLFLFCALIQVDWNLVSEVFATLSNDRCSQLVTDPQRVLLADDAHASARILVAYRWVPSRVKCSVVLLIFSISAVNGNHFIIIVIHCHVYHRLFVPIFGAHGDLCRCRLLDQVANCFLW